MIWKVCSVGVVWPAVANCYKACFFADGLSHVSYTCYQSPETMLHEVTHFMQWASWSPLPTHFQYVFCMACFMSCTGVTGTAGRYELALLQGQKALVSYNYGSTRALASAMCFRLPILFLRYSPLTISNARSHGLVRCMLAFRTRLGHPSRCLASAETPVNYYYCYVLSGVYGLGEM